MTPATPPHPLLALARRALPQPLRDRLGRVYDRGRAGATLATGRPDERRAVVRSGFFALARRFTPIVAVEAGGVRLLLATDDHVIGPGTFAHERPPEADLLDPALALAAVQPGADVLEIGANIGTTTVMLCERLAPRALIAVEPEPRNHGLLVANVALNGHAQRVRTLRLALSDADGEAELELSPDNVGDHRVRAADPERGRATLTVPLRTVDSLAAEGTIDAERLGLVWLDVQGHEGHVLAGAADVLSRGVPVVMELWPYGLERAGGLELLLGLAERHFRAFVELPGGSGERPIAELRALVDGLGRRFEDVTDVLLRP